MIDDQRLRVLLVEDDEDDYLLTVDLLHGVDDVRFESEHAVGSESVEKIGATTKPAARYAAGSPGVQPRRTTQTPSARYSGESQPKITPIDLRPPSR